MAKHQIYAYRVTQADPISQEQVLVESSESHEEPGAGEKLLGVLQKLDIGNILVIVCVWHTTLSVDKLQQGEFFKLITERARELMQSIKQDVTQP